MVSYDRLVLQQGVIYNAGMLWLEFAGKVQNGGPKGEVGRLLQARRSHGFYLVWMDFEQLRRSSCPENTFELPWISVFPDSRVGGTSPARPPMKYAYVLCQVCGLQTNDNIDLAEAIYCFDYIYILLLLQECKYFENVIWEIHSPERTTSCPSSCHPSKGELYKRMSHNSPSLSDPARLVNKKD